MPCATAIATALEGLSVMGTSLFLVPAALITWSVLERRSTEETERWSHVGIATGFIVGVPATICCFVLMAR